MKNTRRVTLYASFFLLTMACCTVRAMDTKKTSEENSITWSLSDIVFVPLTVPLTLYARLWKNQNNPSALTNVHDCVNYEKKEKPSNFVEAQKKLVQLQKKMRANNSKNCTFCKKEILKARKEEKKYWFLDQAHLLPKKQK